jgi:hypothetical protein
MDFHILYFLVGIFFGYFYKIPQPKNKSENYLLCKITHENLFKEFFPENKVQPHWWYYPEKKIIKIRLDEIEPGITFEDHLVSSGIDYEFFQIFADLYIYVYDNNQITVFRPGQTLKTRPVKLIKCNIKGVECDVTDHYQRFTNESLTTEELLLNYNGDFSMETVTAKIDNVLIQLNENIN